MTHLIALSLAVALGAEAETGAPAGASPPSVAAPRSGSSPAPVAEGQAGPQRDTTSDEPPATAYDIQRGVDMPPGYTPERSLVGQLLRTLLALALVILLIFLFAKVALPRIFRVTTVGGGKHVRLLERVQLDGRHALFVVQVGPSEQAQTVLLGTGEQGVQVLAELDGASSAATGEKRPARWRAPFAAALSAIASREGYPGRRQESYDDSQRMGEDDR